MHSSLEKALRDLLLERLMKERSVEIPKIGTFSLHHRVPEKIVSKNKGNGGKSSGKTTLITPPVNEIQFRLWDVKIANDNASELSFRSGHSIPEIEKELSALRRTLDECSSSKTVALEGVGVFKRNSLLEMEFTPDPKLLSVLNFRYVGLGNVDVVPVAVLEASTPNELQSQPDLPVHRLGSAQDDSSAQAVQPEKTSSRKRTASHKSSSSTTSPNWLIPAGFVIVLLLVAGAYLFLNPVKNELSTQIVQIETDDIQSPETADQVQQSQQIQAPDLESQYGLFGDFNEELRGSFAISVFSFSDIDNASEQAAVLLSDGYRMHIRTLWEGESTSWQLTIGQFESREEAEKVLQTLSSTVFPEPEILQLP